MAVISVSDPDFAADPYPAIDEHRHEGLVPNVDHGGLWLLDSKIMWDVLRDPIYASNPERADPEAPITKILKQARLSIFYMDPPEHTRLRGMVGKEFSQRRIAAMTTAIEQTVTTILDELPDRGTVDLASAFGDRVPMVVMTDLLGVEPEMHADFRNWAMTRVMNLFDPKGASSAAFAEATGNLNAYFAAAATERRREPTDDLIGLLANATGDDGTVMDDREIVDLMVLLLGAGVLTSADLIGNVINALLDNPDALAAVRADPELVPVAIEETLRHDCPVLSVGRIATQEVDLCGRTVAPGTWLRVMVCAPGRDPAMNPDPDEFRLDRPDRYHVAFSGGTHHCLGVHLARLEVRAAVQLLLERYPELHRAPGADAAVRRGVPGFRGFGRLLVDVG